MSVVVFAALFFFWIVAIGTLASAFLKWRLARARHSALRDPPRYPRCAQCGYQISDARKQRFCPECGTDLIKIGVEW